MSDLNLNLNATNVEDLVGDLTNRELLEVTRKVDAPLGRLSDLGLDKIIEALAAITWVKARREDPAATYEDALESSSVMDMLKALLSDVDAEAADPS